MAIGPTTNIYLLTYLFTSAVELLNDHNNTVYFNINGLLWLMKDCMGQHFCNAVVWIAELVRVKKFEIS